MVKLKTKTKRLEKDCLDCKRYLSCKDESKAVNYICSKFRERDTIELSEVFTFGSNDFSSSATDIDMSDVEGESKRKTSDTRLDLDKKINVSELINSVLTSDLLTPVDTKIDDSSVPMAKNFYEFTTASKFLGVKPYLFQMLYITQLFSEYCPRCSDLQWMNVTAKVSDTLAVFSSKVVCLDHGVCPKCGSRKSELVKNNEINYYQELAGLAGQRCLVGDSIVHTDNGLTYLKDLLPQGYTQGFNSLEISVVAPDFYKHQTKSIYVSLPEPIATITLANGITLSGTQEHPINTEHGYMPLAALPNGIGIPVRYNYEGFGTKTAPSELAHFYGLYLACGNGDELNTNSPNALTYAKALFGDSCVGSASKVLLPKSPNKSDIIKSVMAWDKTATILFLRAFLPNQISITPEIERLALLQLQMLGIRSYSEDSKVFIDGCDVLKASRMLGVRVFAGHFKFKDYVYNEDTFTYNIPVVSTVISSTTQETYDFVVPNIEAFVANGIDNHNSGKSAIVAMCCAYILHKQIKLQKPNEIYGLLPANVLHGTFVALTYKQAAETLWEPFLAYITDSPWFCIEENTLIDLKDGLKRAIKDIKEGDLVRTHEGFAPVTKVYDNGVKQCYAVTLSNGASVLATEEHKFGKQGETGVEWTPLNQLQIGDTLIVS